MKNILTLYILCCVSICFAQDRQNENWVFGKNQWTFTNNVNGYTATPSNNSTGLTLFDNVVSESSTASISDPDTGQLLFYTDGITVFERNGNVMQNGTELFGTWNQGSGNLLDRFYTTVSFCGGSMGEQTALIIPKPFDVNIYYVISTVKGSYFNYCTQGSNSEFFNLGVRVAEIDMSQNNGLGAVISKNNILNTQGAQGITLAKHTTNDSYWLITNASTNSNSAFSVYQVDSSGINSTPVISSNNQTSFSFIKVSPDNTKIASLGSGSFGSAYYLHDFDATTGIVTSPFKINTLEPNNFLKPLYNNTAKVKGSAEFSENNNILYFIASAASGNSGSSVDEAGICKYNISTGQLVGVTNTGSPYVIPLSPGAQSPSNFVSNLQIGPNQKIYGILNTQISVSPTTNNNETYFVNPINNETYDYIVIDDPNNWQANSSSLLRFIQPDSFAINGYTFPQLVPEFITEPPCDEVSNIRIEQGNLYSWDSNETSFNFQYMEDSRCCGNPINDLGNQIFQITTTNNFIDLDNLPGLLSRECFSVRVKPTDCGEWGDWCCVSGSVGRNYQLSGDCFPSEPCENITFVQRITQDLLNVTNTFNNVINIEATNTITTSNIEYVATQSVTLLPGFQALNGTNFTARIADCNVNNLRMNYNNRNFAKSSKSNKFRINEIAIYPNPVINKVTISSNFDIINTIIFYDLKGVEMLSKVNLNTKAFTMDVSSLSTGIYIIKTIDEKGIQSTSKVVKE